MFVKVAVIQAPPVLLDRAATISGMLRHIAEVAAAGAKLVIFPEAYIPGYPTWVWRLKPGADMALAGDIHSRLREQSVDVGRGDLRPLTEAAASLGLTVVCGLHELDSEFSGTTLFNTVVVIGPDGTILNRHRKLLPTNPERMIWGRGDARGLRVIETPVGRVGCLICWENYMPLARYALYAQNLEILVAPTWDCGDEWIASMRHIAREGGCWVIATGTAFRGRMCRAISRAGIACSRTAKNGYVMGALIVRPSGRSRPDLTIVTSPYSTATSILQRRRDRGVPWTSQVTMLALTFFRSRSIEWRCRPLSFETAEIRNAEVRVGSNLRFRGGMFMTASFLEADISSHFLNPSPASAHARACASRYRPRSFSAGWSFGSGPGAQLSMKSASASEGARAMSTPQARRSAITRCPRGAVRPGVPAPRSAGAADLCGRSASLVSLRSSSASRSLAKSTLGLRLELAHPALGESREGAPPACGGAASSSRASAAPCRSRAARTAGAAICRACSSAKRSRRGRPCAWQSPRSCRSWSRSAGEPASPWRRCAACPVPGRAPRNGIVRRRLETAGRVADGGAEGGKGHSRNIYSIYKTKCNR